MAMTSMLTCSAHRDATPLLTDATALRQRAAEDGCLFFSGLLPAEPLLALRRQVLEVAARHDFLDSAADLEEGRAKPGFAIFESADPAWRDYYNDILRLRDFHALALHPAIIGPLERVFGETVLAHSRNICRTIFPTNETMTTPPHQNFHHIGGTEETWTVWFPLSDCPAELGGLAVLPGSHRNGLLETREAYGAGGTGVDVDDNAAWRWNEMKCGDVIMLQSLTVHQGVDNTSGDRIRNSVDFRYQPQSHPVRAVSFEPHMGCITWDEIYEGWPDGEDPVKGYWEQAPLDFANAK